jgi:hypothetical protein
MCVINVKCDSRSPTLCIYLHDCCVANIKIVSDYFYFLLIMYQDLSNKHHRSLLDEIILYDPQFSSLISNEHFQLVEVIYNHLK